MRARATVGIELGLGLGLPEGVVRRAAMVPLVAPLRKGTTKFPSVLGLGLGLIGIGFRGSYKDEGKWAR